MVTALTNGRIILPDKIVTGVLVLEDSLIKGIADSTPPEPKSLIARAIM